MKSPSFELHHKLLCIGALFAISSTVSATNSPAPQSLKTVELPDRIPAKCVEQASERYKVPAMALLAILKTESNGRTGVVATNKNGTKDIGPAQLNTSSWAKYMVEKHHIPLTALRDNMCQAIMAQAYALRYEWNTCISKRSHKDIWCAIAYYHSPTPKFQRIYVQKVWRHYNEIVKKGRF